MDAIMLLKADHKTVEQLFRKFEKAGDHALAHKRRLVEQMVRELSVHAAIEEQVFYPAVRARAEALSQDVLRALEEHHVMKWVLSELDVLPPESERFDAKVHVLMESVRAHVTEEEQYLFPEVKKVFKPQELRQMGEALAQAKKAAPTHPHPALPDSPPGNLLTGAVAAVMDMGRDALRTARRKAETQVRKAARRPLKKPLESVASLGRTGESLPH
ncbi:hemerythrin domain-containing protein [Corallococcus silvisoli]|uniref:hemerythrin domain-containing protein n=1 Tax=Corallococcus silvisoli TaxID=2697031 RepID=UPI001377C384|nr:hemerythrin domain-containing protein [Corallococcus silvisoli]NBD14415.1 hemerythrin domain-containing protein [Corallococcus silvisoli]